ncbi:MAG TPA: alpha/beta hydrolase [Edaphocola sp.]|nr:alpha/beta hydrolase [Edaphocola sp.]
MDIQEGFLAQNGKCLRCLRMGQGKKLLIAFHGFGQNATFFSPLAELLEKDFTLVAFDFPGESAGLWKSKHYPDNKLVWHFIQKICADLGVDKVSLLGYSMGGRTAMCLTEYYPERVEQLVLLAPDGLQKNIWYRLATREFYGRLIFRHIIHHPDTWIKRINNLIDKGIISSRWQKLVNNTLKKPEFRAQVLVDWPFTRNFIPNPKFLKRKLGKFQIPAHLFMGRFDQSFPPSVGERFAGNNPFVQLHVLQTGHHILHSSELPEVATVLKT